MAVPAKIAARTDAAIQIIRESSLPMSEVDDLISILVEARDGTNGLSLEEKVQANAHNIANLCSLFVRHSVDAAKYRRSWRDVIVECKWPLVICVITLSILIAYRPSVVQTIEALVE